MKRVIRKMRQHQTLLLNWFRAEKQFSSGIVENSNTKENITTRKVYNLKNYNGAEIALYHALGELPVPEIAHKNF